MTLSNHLHQTLLVLALTSAYPAQTLAASPAGVAQFIAGQVSLRGTDGKTAALTKGRDIESGQAILTGDNGRAQVKFTDGGLVSLQPNTEFKIASYADKADPQLDSFLVDFLRGSMRAITGLIGKRNRANYKVTTTTATIGIRGSGFSAGYNSDGTLNVSAEKDAIEVCNAGTCIGLVAGESVRVINATDAPQRTVNRASLPTPGLSQDVENFGNQTTADGKSLLKRPESESSGAPASTTFSDIQVLAVAKLAESNIEKAVLSSAETVFSGNKLIKFTNTGADENSESNYVTNIPQWSESGTPGPAANFSSIGNAADASFIGWGKWTQGTATTSTPYALQDVHYIVGRATSQEDINIMSYSGSYNLVGSTAPTMNGVAGTLSSATFSVSSTAGSYSVSVGVNTSFGNFSDTATSSTARFSGDNGYINGLFIGPNAAFAGLIYAKGFEAGNLTGALAFKKGQSPTSPD